VKTENLAIVMTDIVGYTATTQNQSRRDNARLLATHHRLLLPLVRRFAGRHVKSVGDALLLVFRSPTDAMLCAMAMQDALFEYNRHAADALQLHIRIAASLGEVRVTRHDVFGEAVNLASRLEAITPADEIYLGEALYLAMNKAEVPAQEVGARELKGVTGVVRVYQIPRFSTPRLTPQDVMATQDMTDLVYPYGGAHFAALEAEAGLAARWRAWPQAARVAVIAALVIAPLGFIAARYLARAPAPISPVVVPPAPSATPAPDTAAAVVQPATTSPARPLPPVAAPPPVRRDDRLPPARPVTERERLAQKKRDEIQQARRDYREDRINRKELQDRLEDIERRYR
jgi:class 3 adenylate cyclase